MRTETPPTVRLADYRPYPYRLDDVRLEFQLEPQATRVLSHLRFTRAGDSPAPLRLDGEHLELIAISLNGEPLEEAGYEIDSEGLTIHEPGEAPVVSVEVRINPEANTTLSGLYISGGRYCTQCEAEGFRRITYFPDRPDVLAPYSVRIEAPKDFPYLLSNGNPTESGSLPDGNHFAEWIDPHPKPSYLFALVAGQFDTLKDSFTTRSGRDVDLTIYVEQGDSPRASYAMDSLKRAMRWDEDVFGREYDLDVFQIVAVRDFNFGAMENKGLNIFNSAYVLADEATATDADFEAIESIVAHEYFHNWTGNRITCRDWFQLCLKEGLTVYRDQEFSQDVRSRAVRRIKDVIRLRARQFAEDAGPLAHAVRPDAYARIDNLYTATVYEKGAEIIRMLRLAIGEDAFWSGMNRYFDQHDGDAATIENFIDCFAAFTSVDLDAFSLWYAQAGTPTVSVQLQYDDAQKTASVRLQQACKPSPGQPEKQPFTIPLRIALFGDNGEKLSTRLGDQTSAEHTLLLTSPEETFKFEDVGQPPRLSFNRGFSAPIRVNSDLDEEARCRLAGADDDPFTSWNALQVISRDIIVDAIASNSGIDPERAERWIAAVRSSIDQTVESDRELAALFLHVPTVSDLTRELTDANPDQIHEQRLALRRQLAKAIEPSLNNYITLDDDHGHTSSASAVGDRALQSISLSLLATLGNQHEQAIYSAFQQASTMTETLSALSALSALDTPAFDTALEAFEAKWRTTPLVMDKWYAVQAVALRSDIRSRLQELRKRPDFDLKNPNRVRALAAAFSGNTVTFHASDGWGYDFLSSIVREVDKLNPALSARLLTAFESWRNFDEERRQHASRVLAELAEAKLSRNAQDIINRARAED